MICNADDAKDVLVLALDLVERLGRPVINHPRLIMNTDRGKHCTTFSRIFPTVSFRERFEYLARR